jgi:hypothetical protein
LNANRGKEVHYAYIKRLIVEDMRLIVGIDTKERALQDEQVRRYKSRLKI